MEFSTATEREAFWRRLVERRRTSRLTVAQVCREARVSEASFYQWQRRLGGRQATLTVPPSRPLAPVKIVDDRVTELRLEFPNGIRLYIPSDCANDQLQQVIQVTLAASREYESC